MPSQFVATKHGCVPCHTGVLTFQPLQHSTQQRCNQGTEIAMSIGLQAAISRDVIQWALSRPWVACSLWGCGAEG